LRSDLEAGDTRAQQHAAFWLERGIDRKLAKGPVMTTTYGAQYQGLVDGLVELLTQEVGLLQPWEYESKLLAPSRYLAKRLLATLKHLRAHGVPFVKELVERAAYSYCYVADPDGYAIEFLHFKPAVK
jgi:catechol 2,3-dioxygenase-like lactoylglutathione lyase family enzyme